MVPMAREAIMGAAYPASPLSQVAFGNALSRSGRIELEIRKAGDDVDYSASPAATPLAQAHWKL